MKKAIIVLMCLMVVGTGAFALEMAVGGGLLYNWSTTNGKVDLDYIFPGLGLGKWDWDLSRNGFGVFGFFGFNQYTEINLGFLYKNPGTFKVEGEDLGSDDLESKGALQLGLYGKYPIPISDTFVFFPTIGVDLEYTLGDAEGWWHDLWLRGGVGLDYFLNERMFIRGHLIYGAALPFGGEDYYDLKLTHGLLIKVGLGVML